MKRRLFSIILAIILLFTSVDVSAFAMEGQGSEDCVEELNVNEEDEIVGAELDISSTACELGIRNNGLGGIWIDINSEPYTIMNYNDIAYGKQGCTWFASARAREITNGKAGTTVWSGTNWWNSGKGRYGFSTGQELRAPALACWDGHIAVIEKIEGNTVYRSDGGITYGDGNDKAHGYTSIRTMTREKADDSDGDSFLGYVYLSDSGTNTNPISKFTSSTATNITETSATIEALLDDFYTVTTCGFYFGTSSTNMSKIVENANTKVKKIYYSLGNGSKWVGSLERGTTYYYQFYATINGVEYKGDINTFSTSGIRETNLPIISDVKFERITEEIIRVSCKVTDDSRITHVSFPTWTHHNGQDDLLWDDSKDSGPIYTFDINIKDHNNEKGQYAVHIYAYDECGNTGMLGTGFLYEDIVDLEAPVISNVQFDRISADTVRVSCQVTDDSEVTKVSFPTWTDYNFQDDLIQPWQDNYTGVRNGNIYTFDIKDSEHNYERGAYFVHIYAWDEFNNQAKVETQNYYFQNLYEVIATQTNGHRYELYDDILTWEEAKTKCEELGGHLVTITSQEEQDIVASLLNAGCRYSYFIGGQLQNEEKTWITGESFNYENWAADQPDHGVGWGGDERFYEMFKDGTWNDCINANKNVGFICEYDTVTYTINFDKNHNEATGAMSAQNVETGSTELLCQNQFEREGYHFAGWNTKANGSGTAYADKVAVTALATGSNTEITLYAQWVKKEQLKAPYANIASGSVVEEGTQVILSCEETGAEIYYTLDGSVPTKDSTWYTTPIEITEDIIVKAAAFKDGYLASEVVSFTYYIREKINYTINFDKNSSEAAGTMTAQTYEEGSAVLLNQNHFNRTGYTFAGWNTKADGSGTSYGDRTSVVHIDFYNLTEITLYAQWEKNLIVSTPIADIASGSVVEAGTRVSLSCREEGAKIYYTTDSSIPTSDSALYTVPITINETVTIKAIAVCEGFENSEILEVSYTIAETETIYTIHFDKNSSAALGEMPSATLEADGVFLLPDNTFVWNEYSFAGWNTKADGSGDSYKEGELLYGSKMGSDKNITLYAQWKRMEQLEVPVASVRTGSTVRKGTQVVLEHPKKQVKIYYTTDGTIPTTKSNLYMEPFVITEDISIMAIAAKENYQSSEPVEFTYYVVETGEIWEEDIPEGGLSEVPKGLWIAGLNAEGYAYTGKAITPKVRVYDYTTLLEEKTDYTITYSKNINASEKGNAKKTPVITVKGKGNYTGKDTAEFRINAKSLQADGIVACDVSTVYNGKQQKPVPTIYDNGKKLKNKKDYTVEYVNINTEPGAFTNAGVHKIILHGIGNYMGTEEVQFEITNTALISKAAVSKIKNQVYNDGKEIKPEISVKYKGQELIENQDYTLSYFNNVKVGKATVEIRGIKGFSGVKYVNFNISAISMKKVEINGIYDADYAGKAIVYGEAGFPDKPEVYLDTMKLVEGKDYTVQYLNNEKAGKATVIFTGINGYTGTVKENFQINPYNIWTDYKEKIKVQMDTVTEYEKDGAKNAIVILYGDRVLKEKSDYTLIYKNHTVVEDDDIWEYKTPEVVVRGKGNFEGEFTKTFTILRKDISGLEPAVQDVVFKNKANGWKSVPKIYDVNGKALKAGTDYEKEIVYRYADTTTLTNGTVKEAGEIISAEDRIPAGTSLKVTITGKGKYKGEVTAKYRVVQQSIAKAKAKIAPQVYTGDKIEPDKNQISLTLGKQKLGKNDYEIVSYQNNTKKGTAKVTLKGVGNYGGTKTFTFKIKSKLFSWWK